MIHRVRRQVWLGFVMSLLGALSLAPGAIAAGFPSKPVRIIIGFPPGGGIDTLARTIAPKVGADLGQPLVVENKPGANGIIGMTAAAKAEPDGHTIFLGTTGNISLNPLIADKLPFSIEKDFKPLMQVASVPFLVYANAKFPANNLSELVSYAKAHPGQVHFYSSGQGGLPHLTGVLLNELAGVDTVHVPYKGSSPGMADLIGGQVQIGYDAISIGLPHVQAGKLKALAITSETGLDLLPNVQPANNTVKGLVAVNWYGMLVPANTPDEVVARLHQAIAKALNDPEIKADLGKKGIYVTTTEPRQFAAFIQAEAKKWGGLVSAAKK